MTVSGSRASGVQNRASETGLSLSGGSRWFLGPRIAATAGSRTRLLPTQMIEIHDPAQNPSAVAAEIRRVLRDGGSAEHAAGVQRFFKEEIESHGWRAAALRRAMRQCRKEILRQQDLDFLVRVADKLFSGCVLEEKSAAVVLLENLGSKFGDHEFRLFKRWLDRIRSWADHDGLVHGLIAPMVAAKPERTRHIFRWAKSADRWPTSGLCRSNQGSAGEDVLPRDRQAHQPPFGR